MEDYYSDPNIAAARGEAEGAANEAAVYQSASALLPQKLKDAINEKMDYNKDIIEQKNKAMSEYFQAPSQAREKYQDIWNPFQREALVSKERAMAYQPYANLVDILGQRQGSLADIINAGTAAFQSAVGQKQSAYEIARQKYQDLLGEAGLKSDIAYKNAQLAKGSGSGSGNDMDMLMKFGQMLGLFPSEVSNGETQATTEPEPAYTPVNNQVGAMSPMGEWIYNGSTWESSGFVADQSGAEQGGTEQTDDIMSIPY